MAESLYKCQDCYCSLHYEPIPFTLDSQVYDHYDTYSIACQSILSPEIKNNPVCIDCLIKMTNKADCDIKSKEENNKCYNETLKQILSQIAKHSIDKKFNKIKEEQNNLLKEMEDLEAEDAECDKELKNCILEAQVLEQSDTSFWSEVALFEKKLIETKEYETSILRSTSNAHVDFKTLSFINVLNDAFKIETSLDIGSINGNRLGSNPNNKLQVSWEEINTAFGNVCMLVCALYSRTSESMPYMIYPLGAFSKISAVQGNSKDQKDLKYELYLPSNEVHFNEGLVNLTENIRVLCSHISKMLKLSEITMFPPYEYVDNKDVKGIYRKDISKV